MKGRVAGKVAIITGGSGGLGGAMSRLLVKEGARVVITDCSLEPANLLVKEILEEGGEALALPLDVTIETQWKSVIDKTLAHFGKLDILVNNAGIAPEGGINMPFSEWRQVMSVNLDGTFLGIQAAIRAMEGSTDAGSIINISSIMGIVAAPETAAYSASKAGIRGLTKAAALYCADKGLPVRVNSIHPGMCITPLVERYFEAHPEQRQAHIEKYPLGLLGSPLDIAYGVLYLASDESRFILGSELVIDGGYLAR
jgi:3(or 17)beta-hydroxysteroid dehydrogenase